MDIKRVSTRWFVLGRYKFVHRSYIIVVGQRWGTLMGYFEVPTDEQVVAALATLGGHGTARALCDQLVAEGNPRRDSQLAIQRAAERGRLIVESDWSLRSVEQAVAA